MASQPKQIYEFGPFSIDADERVLLRDGKPVPLTKKAFEVLLLLVERSGHIVDKDALINSVWAGSFVEESNLKVTVSVLRKVLEESAGEQQYIETVPRRGYRFVASVREVPNDRGQTIVRERTRSSVTIVEEDEDSDRDQDQALPAKKTGSTVARVALACAACLGLAFLAYYLWPGRGEGSPAARSIAVLPFKPLVTDNRDEYLELGMADTLITKLSNLREIVVRSTTAVRQYGGLEQDPIAAGKALQVESVLEGNLQRLGDRIRITVRLIRVRDGTPLWADQFDEKFTDIFVVQDSISSRVAAALAVKLTGEEQQQLTKRYTGSVKAFESYNQGRSYIHRRTREDLLKAAQYYEQAIQEDSGYALAYTGLAEVYGNLGARGYIPPIEGRRKLEEAARKALALDEHLADAHMMMGCSFTAFAPCNFIDGDPELIRATELNPNLATARLYLSLSLFKQGRLDEGQAQMLKARDLDPFSAIIARQVSLGYLLKREYKVALQVLEQANALSTPFTTTTEIEPYIQNGLYTEALAKLEQGKLDRRHDPLLIYPTGMVYAAQGKRPQALETITELARVSQNESDQAHWIAKVYAALNETDLAFQWLERGLQTGAVGAFFKDEPIWDSLRADPRFANLVRRMGIPA